MLYKDIKDVLDTY